MTRKSKRELERKIDGLDEPNAGDCGIVFVHERADGTYADSDGTPLEELDYHLCFKLTRPEDGRDRGTHAPKE